MGSPLTRCTAPSFLGLSPLIWPGRTEACGQATKDRLVHFLKNCRSLQKAGNFHPIFVAHDVARIVASEWPKASLLE